MTDHETVVVNGHVYPKWAWDRAWRVMGMYGGNLESTIQAVILLDEAEKNATVADPNEPIRAFGGAGVFIVLRRETEQEEVQVHQTQSKGEVRTFLKLVYALILFEFLNWRRK